MTCSVCKLERPIVARGYCKTCYQRWHKSGSTGYAPKRERHQCNIKGCENYVESNGLCAMHSKRLKRHGHTEQTRPDSWGAKHKHPLFHSWAWMCRHRTEQTVCKEWLDDFLQFVVDVGERPSSKHRLFAADDSKPLGNDNFVWKESITQKVPGEDYRTYQNRVSKVYRRMRKEGYKEYELRKSSGISYSRFSSMKDVSNNTCYICGKQETAIIRGNTINLAVDHCHVTGRVRGLLCTKCNRGLGLFGDSLEILEKALEYLRKQK